MGSTRSPRQVTSACLLALLGPMLVSCSGGDGDDGGAGPVAGSGEGDRLVASALAELPAPEGSEAVMVTVADLAAASEANGLERPASPADAYPDWVLDMTGGSGGTVLVVPPALVATADPADLAAETGFWWGQARRFASVSAPPDDFTVLEGDVDDVEFAAGVTELDGGLRTLGEGEDGEIDPGGSTVVDRLGRPVRLAQRDDRLAMSLSTHQAQAWLDGEGETLGEDESLTSVAAALDDAGAVSAVLATLPGPEPAGVGVGWAAEDEQPVVTIGYAFGSESAAREAGAEAEEAFADGLSAATEQPYSELLELEGVEVSGRVVVATVGVPRERVSTPYDMLVRQDLPLLQDPLRAPQSPGS